MTPQRFSDLFDLVRATLPADVIEKLSDPLHGDYAVDHIVGLRSGSIGSIVFAGDNVVTPKTDEQIVQRIQLLEQAKGDREQLWNLIGEFSRQ